MLILTIILVHGYSLILTASAQGITTYSGPVYVRVGDDFEVKCSTNAFRFPKWSLNGRNLEDDFAIQFIKSKGNGRQEAELRVFDAGPQHSGAYSCDPFDSDKHHVYVVDPENVNDTQRCFLIKPETSLALGCEPEYKTPFFWYYGKDETRYLPKGHVELRTSQLLFHGVQLSDAGRYICRSVKDPIVETTYHLVTPILTQREHTWTKVALIGSSVALDCDFIADPLPQIEWFIGSDHAELKKRAQHRVHISSNPSTGVPNSRLIVQNVNPSDNNAYTCRASHLMCGIQTEQVVMLRAQR